MTKKHGRPPHKRDESVARQVEAMAGYGVSQPEICKAVGIGSINTLKKHYGEELQRAAVRANSRVAESLFRKATGDGPASVTAAIFWLKARAGWIETSRQEVTGKDGGPVETKVDLEDLADDERASLRAILERRAVQSEGGASGA